VAGHEVSMLGETGLALAEVQAAMRSTGYPEHQIGYVSGRVEETIPESAPSEIALLRLDTDWYGSTRHELEHLYPRLVSGGVLIVDDYGHYAGARQAVDEYFAGRPILLARVDYTGRMAVKP
jgi:O-methyltransferase